MLAIDFNYFDAKLGDASTEGYALFAGKKLTDHFGVEGSVSVSSKETEIYDPVTSASFQVNLKQFVDVSAVARQRLFAGLILSARAGIASIDWTISGATNAKTTGVTFGGNLAYEYSNHARIFIEYQKFPDADTEISNVKVASRTISLGGSVQF